MVHPRGINQPLFGLGPDAVPFPLSPCRFRALLPRRIFFSPTRLCMCNWNPLLWQFTQINGVLCLSFSLSLSFSLIYIHTVYYHFPVLFFCLLITKKKNKYKKRFILLFSSLKFIIVHFILYTYNMHDLFIIYKCFFYDIIWGWIYVCTVRYKWCMLYYSTLHQGYAVKKKRKWQSEKDWWKNKIQRARDTTAIRVCMS